MVPTYLWMRIANAWSLCASFIPFSHSIYDCCMKVVGSCICWNVFLGSPLVWEHTGEDSSMWNRHREIISSLFVRPRDISREVLLFVQYLSWRTCSHRLCLQVDLYRLEHDSQEEDSCDSSNAGTLLVEWLVKRPPSSPQSQQGLCAQPQMQKQEKPSHFKETSVTAWLKGVLQTSWDHSIEVIFCRGYMHRARRTFFSMQPDLILIARMKR